MNALHTIEMSVSKQITSREGYANANRPCLFVISSGMGADGSSTARNVLTHPPAGTPRRALSPGEGFPVRQTSIQGSGRGCPLLRASNEHFL